MNVRSVAATGTISKPPSGSRSSLNPAAPFQGLLQALVIVAEPAADAIGVGFAPSLGEIEHFRLNADPFGAIGSAAAAVQLILGIAVALGEPEHGRLIVEIGLDEGSPEREWDSG